MVFQQSFPFRLTQVPDLVPARDGVPAAVVGTENQQMILVGFDFSIVAAVYVQVFTEHPRGDSQDFFRLRKRDHGMIQIAHEPGLALRLFTFSNIGYGADKLLLDCFTGPFERDAEYCPNEGGALAGKHDNQPPGAARR